MTAPGDPPRIERELEPATPEELEADIAHTREQMGRTVEALSDKLDVTARMRDKVRNARVGGRHAVARVRQQAAHGEGEPNDVAPAAALVAVTLGAIVMAVVRSRRS